MTVEVDGPSKAINNLQQIVKADREIHTSSTQADSDGITFNKALYQRYLQCKENESNTNRGNNPDKQSKQRNQSINAIMRLRMNPMKKTIYTALQQLTQNSSLPEFAEMKL